MKAGEELLQLRQRLSDRLNVLHVELETVDASIRLIEREKGLEPSTHHEFAKMGLTESCLRILDADFISPAEVRDLLIQGGYPKSDRQRLLGSVYATLKRLHGAGKVEFRKPRGGGGRKYRVKQNTAEPSEE